MKKELGKMPKMIAKHADATTSLRCNSSVPSGQEDVPCRHTIKGIHTWSEAGMGGR